MGEYLPLDEVDKKIYEWQMWVKGFGEQGQLKLKNASVFISRCGGLGGIVATELAAAGIGKLVIAHGGDIRYDDMNRQTLMSWDKIGQPRVEAIQESLHRFNPRIQVELYNKNVTEMNMEELINKVDIVVSCAPLFEERFLMNRFSVLCQKPMVDASMYEMECQLMTIVPGKSACLKCLYPSHPTQWKREFPVFGAVSASVGAMAAMEVIKVIAGIGGELVRETPTLRPGKYEFQSDKSEAQNRLRGLWRARVKEL